MTDWVEGQKVPGLTMEVLQNDGMTPLIFMEVAATDPEAGTVLLYGHLDKQPPFEGWVSPWSPYDPVLTEDGKLYGRGGADDGYGWSAVHTAVAHLCHAHTHEPYPGRTSHTITLLNSSGALQLYSLPSRPSRV